MLRENPREPNPIYRSQRGVISKQRNPLKPQESRSLIPHASPQPKIMILRFNFRFSDEEDSRKNFRKNRDFWRRICDRKAMDLFLNFFWPSDPDPRVSDKDLNRPFFRYFSDVIFFLTHIQRSPRAWTLLLGARG